MKGLERILWATLLVAGAYGSMKYITPYCIETQVMQSPLGAYQVTREGACYLIKKEE